MFDAVRLDDGGILAPGRAEGPDGMIGDGIRPFYPGDPMFDLWDEWLRAQGK
jgi:hypothetical protein